MRARTKCIPRLSLCVLSVLCVSVVCVSRGTETQRSPKSHRGLAVFQQTSEGTSALTGESQDPAKKQLESDTDVIRVETNLVNTLFTAVDKDRHFITSLRSE